MGLPTIAVPPAQPPQPYLRHGSGPCVEGWIRWRCIASDAWAWVIDLGCVLQSLRLSTDNEQNLCNLAHCVLGYASVPT